jgi:hypothetical protein
MGIRSKATRVLFGLCVFIPVAAFAADTYDGTYLRIARVQVGGTVYGDVWVRPRGVVSVGYDKLRSNPSVSTAPSAYQDSFDPATGRLTMPVVQAYGTVYADVVVTIQEVVFVGGVFGSNLGTLSTAYASTTGSDANPGTLSQPFRTAQMCASTLAPGGTCYLRQGTYAETVTPNSNTMIASYPNETATIDGSDPVPASLWSKYQGSIYRAPLSLAAGDSNQVFVGGEAMTEARWPNGDDLFHPVWATAQSGTTASTLVDANLPSANLAGTRIHWWSGSDPWDPQTGVITSSGAGQATFSLDGASFLDSIVPQSGGYYHLFGSLALLDTPREWYYDAGAGQLYFWAPKGADPAQLPVSVKQRQYAFDLNGASNVTLKNLQVIAANVVTDINSSGNTLDTLKVTYPTQFTTLPDMPTCPWAACNTYPNSYWYNHIADSGIVINGSGNAIVNSEIAYSAGNGVSLLGSGNTVRNNLIHHVGAAANNTSGVAIQGTGHHVTNNTIYAVPRFAIFLGTVSYYPYVPPNNNDVSYNNIFDCVMVSRDAACIYAGGQPGVSGTVIHHNWIHDSSARDPGPAASFALAGVYFDEDASGWAATQNVLWNNQGWNVFIHGGTGTVPMDIIVANNSIPDAAQHAAILLLDVVACGSTQIANNQVLAAPQQVSYAEVGSNCTLTNNSATAAGATEMASVVPGCNFAGCSSSAPPAVVNGVVAASIQAAPFSRRVSPGAAATFSVIGAGSGPLGYQWQRNGLDIPGATSPTYTTPATSLGDDGTSFTVTVSNSLGNAKSTPAILNVE